MLYLDVIAVPREGGSLTAFPVLACLVAAVVLVRLYSRRSPPARSSAGWRVLMIGGALLLGLAVTIAAGPYSPLGPVAAFFPWR